MPEGQTEVERRYLKSGKKPVQMQKTNIFARIPLPPQCAHWGTFPPGEGFVTAPQLPDKLQFDTVCRKLRNANHQLVDKRAEIWYDNLSYYELLCGFGFS